MRHARMDQDVQVVGFDSLRAAVYRDIAGLLHNHSQEQFQSLGCSGGRDIAKREPIGRRACMRGKCAIKALAVEHGSA